MCLFYFSEITYLIFNLKCNLLKSILNNLTNYKYEYPCTSGHREILTICHIHYEI